MGSKYLLGAAAVALVSATGAANAADVLPIGVAVTPAVVAPAAVGPEITVTLEKSLAVNLYGLTNLDTWLNGYAEIRVKSASGLGFEVWAADFLDQISPFYLGYSVGARVFREAGAIEIGAFVGFRSSIPFMGYGLWFGGDLKFETDTAKIEHWTTAYFYGGGFDEIDLETEFKLNPNDLLEITGYTAVDFELPGVDFYADGEARFMVREHLQPLVGAWLDLDGGGPEYGVWGGLRLPFGSFTPYVTAWWDPTDPEIGFDIGIDIKHQIGDGPLTIFGFVEYERDTNGQDLYAQIGIRFGGDPDDSSS